MNDNPPGPQETPPTPAVPGGRQALRLPRPYVTYGLIGVCILVYLLQLGTQSLLGVDIPAAWGVKDNQLIMQGQVWRLITPMFLHSDQTPLHIGVNMYALYVIGRIVERFYGRRRYLALFILSGFAGNVISFMFSQYPSLGSSTSIFGLLGAEGVLLYQNREIFGGMARRALSEVLIVAAANLVIGLTPGIGIDNWGHIGGLIGGSLFAWFGGPILQRQGSIAGFSQVKDARTTREMIRAGIGVGALFFFLTVAAMLMRKG